jgi:hypothetical protein
VSFNATSGTAYHIAADSEFGDDFILQITPSAAS